MAGPIKDGGRGSVCLFVCFKHNVLFECDFFQTLDALWINSFLIDQKEKKKERERERGDIDRTKSINSRNRG